MYVVILESDQFIRGYNIIENYLSLSQQLKIAICIMAVGGTVYPTPLSMLGLGLPQIL